MRPTMSDLQLLAWLRWRQARSNALYWLGLVGYEPGKGTLSDRAYQLYLLIFGAWWAVAMGAIAFHEAAQLGSRLDPQWLALSLEALPWLVLAIQVVTATGALRSTPLKLTFPDMAYLAGSPVARWAPVLVGWLQAVTRNLLISLPAAALLAVCLAQGALPIGADRAALWAVVVAFPLAILMTGLAWSLGLCRLAWPRLRRWRLARLCPLLLLGLACFLPGPCLWPGRTLALAMLGQATPGRLLLLSLLAMASGGAVAWLGGRANMIDVSAESTTSARLRSLGVMAWLSPELANAIRTQAALAARRPFLSLPRAQGPGNLLARAGLLYLRRPSLLLWTLLWSAILLQGSFLLVPGSAFAPPSITWLLAVLVAPPRGLLEVFQADAGNQFLRQFLPLDGLRLLLADVAAPLAVLIVSASLAWVAMGASLAVTVTGMVTVALLGALLALCQGISLVQIRLGVGARSPRPYLGMIPRRLRIPHPLAPAVSFGALIASRALLRTPLATLGLGAALLLGLCALIGAGPCDAPS
jgi:hypothetical protein